MRATAACPLHRNLMPLLLRDEGKVREPEPQAAPVSLTRAIPDAGTAGTVEWHLLIIMGAYRRFWQL